MFPATTPQVNGLPYQGPLSGLTFVDLVGYEYGFVEVTPEIAQSWLDLNTRNRAKRKRNIEKYTSDMIKGFWTINGATIVFSATDILLDGQHRLESIVTSGTSQYLFVFWGVKDLNVQDTIDTGTARALRDQMVIKGRENANYLSSTVSRIVAVDKGMLSYAEAPTHQEALAFLEANPDVVRAGEIAAMAGKARLRLSPAAVGAAYFYCARINQEFADVWFESQVIKGLALMPGDPAKAFRDRTEANFRTTGKSFNAPDTYNYLVSCWNAARDGRKLEKAAQPKGGWTKLVQPK